MLLTSRSGALASLGASCVPSIQHIGLAKRSGRACGPALVQGPRNAPVKVQVCENLARNPENLAESTPESPHVHTSLLVPKRGFLKRRAVQNARCVLKRGCASERGCVLKRGILISPMGTESGLVRPTQRPTQRGSLRRQVVSDHG